MKNLIKSITILIALSLFTSCDNDMEDHVTGDASEGGALVIYSTDSEGKTLGTPQGADLTTASIAFSDAELDLTVLLHAGGQNVTKYELVKSLNGGNEVVVATGNSLPLNVTYTTIEEFINGTGISDSQDLRIGDVFTFRTKIYSGNGVNFADKIFKVKIGCSSALVSDYAVTTTRSNGSTVDQGIETLREVSPGVYKTITTGPWTLGQLPPADQGFIFEDLCNDLTVPNQNLADYYSNIVYQTDDQAAASKVDPDTGNLHIEYTISFSDGDAAYTNDYIKQ